MDYNNNNNENRFRFEIEAPQQEPGIQFRTTDNHAEYKRIRKMFIRIAAVVCAVSLLVGGGVGVLVSGALKANNAPTADIEAQSETHDGPTEKGIFIPNEKNGKSEGETPKEDSGSASTLPATRPSVTSGDTLLYTTDTGTKAMTTEEVVEKVEASVVAIVINYRQSATYGFQTYYRTAQASGSGVIVSQDGYIVTNNHVVEDAETINVTLSDGSAYEAKLIGTDATTDLALIKIEASGLQPAEIGESETLKRGQTAIIIGNPLGYLEGSVSAGIISGLDRTLSFSDGSTIYHMIQTDASVNPGNSGGGLFNDRGQLIGIVSAKTSATSIEGLGFAIPSEVFKDIINDLYTYGYVKGRPALGVNIVPVTSAMEAMYYGLSRTGLYVQSFVTSEAESKSELQVGDCIVSVNGTEVLSNSEILSLVSELKIGDTVEVGIYRNNEFMTVKSTLIEQDASY